MAKRPIPLSRIRNPNIRSLSDLFKVVAEDDDTGELTAKQNVANRDLVVRDWMLGPEKTSVDPEANAPYWQEISAAWNVSEAEARLRFCANCEYYDNTPAQQQRMLAVPNDKFDMDGGGRGFCVKFDFICHNLRVCQAWEEKPFGEKED